MHRMSIGVLLFTATFGGGLWMAVGGQEPSPAASPQTADKGKPAKKVEPPRIRFKGISSQPTGEGHVTLLFEAYNPNAEPLPYSGYVADSFSTPLTKEEIAPQYHIEYKRDGKWTRESLGWCGTGRGPVQLEPKTKPTFTVVVGKSGWEEVKVGVSWLPPGDQKGVYPIAWSAPVSLKAIEKAIEVRKKP
jgi:hypothetical protein